MRRSIVASFCMLLVTSIAPARTQVVIDLSLITCKQLLDSDAERQALISSWMSGYFSATKNLSELDFRYGKGTRRWSETIARRTSQIPS